MHSLQLGKEALYQIPIRVEFAGFVSDTYALGKAGWDLSLEQFQDPYRYNHEIRLAIRHGTRESALYGFSHPTRIEAHPSEFVAHPSRYMDFLKSIMFSIAYMSPSFHFRVMPIRTQGLASFSSQFAAFDPTPQEMLVEDIRDFKFFKVADQSVKNLIVNPEDVAEILDVILRVQDKGQKEIRARDRSRENFKLYGPDGYSVEKAHNVQAQILTLVG